MLGRWPKVLEQPRMADMGHGPSWRDGVRAVIDNANCVNRFAAGSW